ncbi:putative integral membrane protein [Brugia pahangi]
MHILLIPHVCEICAAVIIMLVLLFWPVYICREVTDNELEKAYINDEQCALELRENLKLVKNDTVVEILQQQFDDPIDNITWLNIRHEYYYEKFTANSICVLLGFRQRFGATNKQYGSAHLLIPIITATITIFFLSTHIFEFITDNDKSSLTIQIFCELICWLIISISLTIIDFNWNGTIELLRNLGAAFPFEWKICKYVAWFWAIFATFELLMMKCCQNIIIKFDKPFNLTIVNLPNDYMFIDESAPPYPNDYTTTDSAVDLM